MRGYTGGSGGRSPRKAGAQGCRCCYQTVPSCRLSLVAVAVLTLLLLPTDCGQIHRLLSQNPSDVHLIDIPVLGGSFNQLGGLFNQGAVSRRAKGERSASSAPPWWFFFFVVGFLRFSSVRLDKWASAPVSGRLQLANRRLECTVVEEKLLNWRVVMAYACSKSEQASRWATTLEGASRR